MVGNLCFGICLVICGMGVFLAKTSPLQRPICLSMGWNEQTSPRSGSIYRRENVQSLAMGLNGGAQLEGSRGKGGEGKMFTISRECTKKLSDKSHAVILGFNYGAWNFQ